MENRVYGAGGRSSGRGVGSERLNVRRSDEGRRQANQSGSGNAQGGSGPVSGGRPAGSGGGRSYLDALRSGREHCSHESGGCSSGTDDDTQHAADQTPKLEVSPAPKTPLNKDGKRVPIERPDGGGRLGELRNLQVNHFPVKFDPNFVIRQYDIQVERKGESKLKVSPKVSKPERLSVKNEYLRRKVPEGMSATAYDGEKNIYSAIQLPEGVFELAISRGDDDKPQTYTFTIELVKHLELRRLQDYLQRSSPYLPCPRDILQALDVIFKENPSRTRIQIGKLFYPKTSGEYCDLGWGIEASRGLQQSLKPTRQALTLCVDYTVNAFLKPLSVIDFLKERLGMSFVNKTMSLTAREKEDVHYELKSLKVIVNHRKSNQKFVVVGLGESSAKIEFTIDDANDPNKKKVIGLREYYKSNYGKKIAYENLPCLDLSRNGRANYVPMEFCELAEAQKYPKEKLDKVQKKKLRSLALAKPFDRKTHICQLVKAVDGPYSPEIFKHFKLELNFKMTEATGRVLKQPGLKIRDSCGDETLYTPENNGQWNFQHKKVLDGKRIDVWGILDFSRSPNDIGRQWDLNAFVKHLVGQSRELGIDIKEKPIFIERYSMQILENPTRLRSILEKIHKERKNLQILLCPVNEFNKDGYKNLKRICKTELGIVTQCCRSSIASKLDDKCAVNLALKINMKMGGSNFELFNRLPGLPENQHVMFIGADVNHPTGHDRETPSIAAVTATINWPAANKYAARFRPQKHRMERIIDIGAMCLELVETYVQVNKVKPQKIIMLRDGVGDSQSDTVLNEELQDIKSAICSEGYSPTITVVVAQKRHHTRFFLGNRNVEPGTVVEGKIVHPFEFDFYLCSHYGILGTSRATHYHVLWDEHSFTADQLQQIIYNLCYTFAPSTNPISLVPPVYCADIVAYKGRLYYENWLQCHSPASGAFSSPSSSTGYSSQASFDLRAFPKLHSNVENLI